MQKVFKALSELTLSIEKILNVIRKFLSSREMSKQIVFVKRILLLLKMRKFYEIYHHYRVLAVLLLTVL